MSITPHTEAWQSQISEAWAPWAVTAGFLGKQLGLTLFTALSSITGVLGGRGGEQAACFLLTLARDWVRMLKEWKVTLTTRVFAYTFVKTTKMEKKKQKTTFTSDFSKPVGFSTDSKWCHSGRVPWKQCILMTRDLFTLETDEHAND